VPPGDTAALAEALRRWFTDENLRRDLWTSARRRRAELSTWDQSVADLGRVLANLRG
jgi:glycosyltransferase involved in cell wall biosynthesis